MIERRTSAVAGTNGLASGKDRRVAFCLMSLAVAVALGGCGSSTGGNPGSSVATAPAPVAAAVISRAATVTDSAKGSKLRMTVLETVPAVGTVTLTESGSFSNVTHSGTMTLTVNAAGKKRQVHEILVAPKVYVEEPPTVAAKLPGHKRWLLIDFSLFGNKSYLSNLSKLTTSPYESPTQALSYLKAESTSIQDYGPATVNGDPTTHYHLLLNLDKVGTGLPKKTRALLRGMLRKMPETILNKTQIPVDVWIDAAHLVRKMQLSMNIVPDGTSVTVTADTTIDVMSYGPQPTPSPPPANQTLNLLALLRAQSATPFSAG